MIAVKMIEYANTDDDGFITWLHLRTLFTIGLIYERWTVISGKIKSEISAQTGVGETSTTLIKA